MPDRPRLRPSRRPRLRGPSWAGGGLSGALLVLPLLLLTPPGLAQARGQDTAGDCGQDAAACGRFEFEAGIAAYRAEDFARAVRHFQAAQAFKPHPVVLFNLALAEAKTGRCVDASAHLREVFDDPETPAELLDEVRRRRAALELEIATVSIDEAGARLSVDGVAARGEPAMARVDPGVHRVRIETADGAVTEREVSLGPGERLRIAVTPPPPAPLPAAPVVAEEGVAEPNTGAAVAASVPPSAPAVARWSPNRAIVLTLGSVTLGLAAASLVSDVDADRAYRDFEADAPRLTEAEARDRIDEGKARDRRTHWLLGLTGAAAVTTGLFTILSLRQRAWVPGRALRLELGPKRLVVLVHF